MNKILCSMVLGAMVVSYMPAMDQIVQRKIAIEKMSLSGKKDLSIVVTQEKGKTQIDMVQRTYNRNRQLLNSVTWHESSQDAAKNSLLERAQECCCSNCSWTQGVVLCCGATSCCAGAYSIASGLGLTPYPLDLLPIQLASVCCAGLFCCIEAHTR